MCNMTHGTEWGHCDLCISRKRQDAKLLSSFKFGYCCNPKFKSACPSFISYPKGGKILDDYRCYAIESTEIGIRSSNNRLAGKLLSCQKNADCYRYYDEQFLY